MIVGRFLTRGIGLISTAVLARLLMPEDFGLVASALAIEALIAALGRGSFRLSLIKNQSAGPTHYDTVWTLCILRGALIGVLLSLSASVTATWFGDARLESIIYIFAIMAFIGDLKNVGTVDFRKHLEFHKQFRFEIYGQLSYVVLAVGFAIPLENYWALVLGALGSKVTDVAVSYRMSRYRPRLCLLEWRETLVFSKWIVLDNLLTTVNGRASAFILAKLTGLEALGLYTVASRLSRLANQQLVRPTTGALFPGFAKIADQRERLTRLYLDTLSLIVLFAVPATVGIACTAELLVPILFGQKWLAAVPVVEVLAVAALLNCSSGGSRSVLLALGRPQIVTALSGIRAVVLLPLLYLGVSMAGPYGAAWAVVAASGVSLVATRIVIGRLLELSVGRLVYVVWRAGVAASIMAVTLVALGAAWPAAERIPELLLQLLVFASVGAASYATSYLLLLVASGAPAEAERKVLRLMEAKFRWTVGGRTGRKT